MDREHTSSTKKSVSKTTLATDPISEQPWLNNTERFQNSHSIDNREFGILLVGRKEKQWMFMTFWGCDLSFGPSRDILSFPREIFTSK
jgi:hypothetical protein